MAVKTITITTEAYESIRRLKGEEESFSDLFLRISGSSLTAKELLGVFSGTPKEFEDLKKNVKRIREDMNKDMNERTKNVYSRFKRAN